MNKEGWQKVYAAAKEYGLNHLRFHSWCPPEAAFEAADEMGFYLQVELPAWVLTIGQDSSAVRFLSRPDYQKLRQSPLFLPLEPGKRIAGRFHHSVCNVRRIESKG